MISKFLQLKQENWSSRILQKGLHLNFIYPSRNKDRFTINAPSVQLNILVTVNLLQRVYECHVEVFSGLIYLEVILPRGRFSVPTLKKCDQYANPFENHTPSVRDLR